MSPNFREELKNALREMNRAGQGITLYPLLQRRDVGVVELAASSEPGADVRRRMRGMLRRLNISGGKLELTEILCREMPAAARSSWAAYPAGGGLSENVTPRRGLHIPRAERCGLREALVPERAALARLKKRAAGFPCAGSVLAELDRIGASRTARRRVRVHPVHYVINDRDEARSLRIAELLITALHTRGRVSRRYAQGDLWDLTGAEAEKLYREMTGGTVLLWASGPGPSGCEDGDDTEMPWGMGPGVADVVSRYRGEVLTIFITDYRDGLSALPERCVPVRTVVLDSERLEKEQAVRYLLSLAAKNGVPYEPALFQPLSEGGIRTVSELEAWFSAWMDRRYIRREYPAYAALFPPPEKTAALAPAESVPERGAAEELAAMIGLGEVKKLVGRALAWYRMEKLMKERGLAAACVGMHMMFTGNPGTAKTTVARLFARLLKEQGVLPEGKLVEVGRSDLVGRYVGWTAQLVKQKFEEARGSVLFIDEAYSLLDDQNGSFGDEAINTIVQEMENHREDVIVIFAGYPQPMEEFIRRNPGLRSRIAFTMSFSDYTPEELVKITELLAERSGKVLGEGSAERLLTRFTRAAAQPDFGNGRFARKVLEEAVMRQAERLMACPPEQITDEALITLAAEDFSIAEAVKAPRKKQITMGFQVA